MLIFKNRKFAYNLLCLCVFFAQSQNYSIKYKASLNDYSNITSNEINAFFKSSSFTFDYVSFNLYFNDNEMLFTLDKLASLPVDEFENVMLISDFSGSYNKINNTDTVYITIPESKNYKSIICKKKIITNWKIFDDKKTIAGYECLKAQCTLGTDYGDGEIIYSNPLTAWYCPEIKNSIGPKGIGGLPGVILELKQNLITFTATEIEFNAPQKDLSLPKLKIIKEMDLIKYIQSSTNNK